MNKDDANRKMKFAFDELRYAYSGVNRTAYHSGNMVARNQYRELRDNGFHWQATRVQNYRHRLMAKHRK